MSIETRITSSKPELKLFQSGEVNRLFDFPMTAETFYTVGSVDVSSLTPEKITIFCFGHSELFGTEYLVQPNVSSFLTVETASTTLVFDGGYQYENGIISFGISHTELTTTTPIAPFSTARIIFSIFYY